MTLTYQCAICGHRAAFNAFEKTAVRDNDRCGKCRGMQRQRDLAQLIVDEFGDGAVSSLEESVKHGLLDHLDVYEVGMKGPFGPRLAKLPGYIRSYFWDDVALGSLKDGVRCEDLRQLTFPNESFDLILSAEVLEHVFKLPLVLTELHRVLKRGGVHVFSIPNRFPFPGLSTIRATLTDGGIVHNLPEYYHIAGDGGKSLVVTDFGRDLIKWHAEAGLRLSVVRRSSPLVPQYQNATFVARKIK